MQMNEVCKKCGRPISNDFGVTLSFCTNCGSKIELREVPQAFGLPKRVPAIVIGVIVVAVLVPLFITIAAYFVHISGKSGRILFDPAGRARVSAEDITKVTYSTWRHAGPLVGPGDGRVISQTISFASDLTASKTESFNYDDGDDRDSSKVFRGQIDPVHFERLTQELVDNDFLNEPDSQNRRSESDARLIVTYKTGKKVILTSNTNMDTEEVRNILAAIAALEGFVTWREAK